MKFPTNPKFCNLWVAGYFERPFYFREVTLRNQIRQTFGEILREHRIKQGRSQEVVSILSGTARQTISKYECKGGSPELETIYFIASALGMSVGEFMQAFDEKLSERRAYQEVAEEAARQRKVRRKALKDDSVLYEVNGPDKIKKAAKKAAESTSIDEAKNGRESLI